MTAVVIAVIMIIIALGKSGFVGSFAFGVIPALHNIGWYTFFLECLSILHPSPTQQKPLRNISWYTFFSARNQLVRILLGWYIYFRSQPYTTEVPTKHELVHILLGG